MSHVFTTGDDPDDRLLDRIGKGLATFNEGDVGPSARRLLVVSASDAEGEVVAGLYGYTAWTWLFVQWLWVSDKARGQGLAAALLGRAETEALARSCHGAWIDTFNPVALKVYERAGYAPFGALEDFPPGRTRTFLKKRLTP